MGEANDSGARHMPALDGLRAVAVGAVVAYHLGLPWARGGYLGVDLFFVLSGFLITGLLVAEREDAGRNDLRRFYSRRARRLLPALFVLLMVVSLGVALARTGIDVTAFRGDVLAALGYIANWRFVVSHQGYFDQFTIPSPIRHMWSLAIEEQFYVLWPLLLIGLLRVGGKSRRIATWATVLVAAASVADMALLYHPGSDPSRVYYGTDARAFELLVGAVLALAVVGRPDPGPRTRRALHVMGALALGGLLWMIVSVPDTAGWMYRGGFLLAALLGVVVVWSVSMIQTGPLGVFLALAPLRWIGLISYGIYLWHWPVIDLLTGSATGLSGNSLRLVQVGVMVSAAALSFFIVESPVRRGRVLRRRGWLTLPVGVSATVTAVLVATSAATAGVSVATTASTAGVSVAATDGGMPAIRVQASAAESLSTLPLTPTTADDTTTTTMPAAPATPVPPPLGLIGLRVATAQDPLRVLIVGDSLMWDASVGIAAALQATGVARVDLKAVLGFGLAKSVYAYPWRAKWPQLVASDRPDLVIAMFGGWDAAHVVANGPAWYANLVDQATAILTSAGARLLWLEYPRNQPPDIPGKPANDRATNERARRQTNDILADSARRHAGIIGYLPIGAVVDRDGDFATFLPRLDGVLERVRKHDNTHFCPAGAERMGRWVLEAIGPVFGLPAASPTWAAGRWRQDPRYDFPHGACA